MIFLIIVLDVTFGVHNVTSNGSPNIKLKKYSLQSIF